MEKWNKIRQDFPIFEKQVYLQTQGGGSLSTTLIEEISQRLLQQSLHGGEIYSKWDLEVEEIRDFTASLLNTKGSNFAFVPSTSFAMNAFAYGLNNSFKVLTFKDDFPNSSLPWMNAGYDVDFVKSNINGEIHFEDIVNAITSETKILITSHVMYRTGFRQDLKRIGELCREKEIIFIVDATQSFGAFEIDVDKFQIDALTFHGYKWMNSGTGIGGMYLSDRILSKYKKPLLGFTSVNYLSKPHDTSHYEVKVQASAYELGKTPYLNIFMLGHMVKQITVLTVSDIQQRILHLVQYCKEKCKENDLEVVTNFDRENLSGILNIEAYGVSKKDLQNKAIVARSNGDIITLGIHYYNNEEDINTIIDFVTEEKNNRL